MNSWGWPQRFLLSCALVTLSINLLAQRQPPPSHPPLQSAGNSVLLAIASDWARPAGNIGASPDAQLPEIPVEIIASVSSTGRWTDLNRHCGTGDGSGCSEFLKDYLEPARDYTLITLPGWGSIAHVKPVTELDECYGYSSSARLIGTLGGESAIGADRADLFLKTSGFESASSLEVVKVRSSLLRLGPRKVRTTTGIRVRRFQLEKQTYYLADRLSSSGSVSGIIFAIGTLDNGKFKLLHWGENGGEDGDTVESALGLIRLRNGREFLLTIESDPEGHTYHAYGLINDEFKLVFSGGGASC